MKTTLDFLKKKMYFQRMWRLASFALPYCATLASISIEKESANDQHPPTQSLTQSQS